MENETAHQIWKNLFSITDKFRDTVAKEHLPVLAQLTFNQLRMIKLVYQLQQFFPSGIALKTLADRLSITPAAASEMVDSLVRRDFLFREPNPEDRRAISIRLSNRIMENFKRGEAVFTEKMRVFLERFSSEEQQNFFELLKLLDAALPGDYPEMTH